MRRIGRPLIRVEGIAGATDLGDGRVVLILDPVAWAAWRGGVDQARTSRRALECRREMRE